MGTSPILPGTSSSIRAIQNTPVEKPPIPPSTFLKEDKFIRGIVPNSTVSFDDAKKDINKFVNDLDSDFFRKREEATKKLNKLLREIRFEDLPKTFSHLKALATYDKNLNPPKHHLSAEVRGRLTNNVLPNLTNLVLERLDVVHDASFSKLKPTQYGEENFNSQVQITVKILEETKEKGISEFNYLFKNGILDEAKYPAIIFGIAQSEYTPDETLRDLYKNGDNGLKATVAFNKNLPEDLKTKILSNGNYLEIRHLLTHLPLKEEYIPDFARLCNVNNPTSAALLRNYIIQYKGSIPENVFHAILNCESPILKSCLSFRKDTFKKAIDKLLDDKDPITRTYTADSPHLNTEHIDKLVNDTDSSVRNVIASRYDPEKFKLTSEQLDALSFDSDSKVRASLASSNIPDHIVDRLVYDADAKVRSNIACNETSPDWAYEILVDDAEEEIRCDLIFFNFNKLSLESQIKLSLDEKESVRKALALASRQNLPREVLDNLLHDKSATVRETLIFNSKQLTPDDFNHILAKGEITDKRALATRNDLSPELVQELKKLDDKEINESLKIIYGV